MADDDFGASIEKWYRETVEAMTLTVDETAEITAAGAQVFSDELQKLTPRSTADYSKGRSAGHANAKHHNGHRKTQHLADTITFKPGYTADGNHTGATDTGFSDTYYDFVARIVNDGKRQMSAKEMKNLHFYDKAQAAAADKALAAQAAAFKRKVGGDK